MSFNPLDYPVTFLQPTFISGHSAWVEHIPFAYAITAMLRPRQFVELGVHAGDSYCAFCQAAKTLELTPSYFAVDTWKGDTHAGSHALDFLSTLRKHHDPEYASFSTLLQMDFDTAAVQFEPGVIDLLHIDGLHTYEAVKHDFQTWLPKMSDQGVILFHDTIITRDNFGVFHLWAELAAEYPHFHFGHGSGLGVLAVGKNVPELLRPMLDATTQCADAIRNFYSRIGQELHTRIYYTGVIQHVFQGQSLINQWKQMTQQPILPATQNIQVAMNNPSGFVQNMVQDIHALAKVDLDLRQHLQKLQAQPMV